MGKSFEEDPTATLPCTCASLALIGIKPCLKLFQFYLFFALTFNTTYIHSPLHPLYPVLQKIRNQFDKIVIVNQIEFLGIFSKKL